MYDPKHGDLAVVVWHDGGPSDERLAQFRKWHEDRPGRWFFVGTDVTAPRHAVTMRRRVGLFAFADIDELPALRSEARQYLLNVVQRPADVI